MNRFNYDYNFDFMEKRSRPYKTLFFGVTAFILIILIILIIVQYNKTKHMVVRNGHSTFQIVQNQSILAAQNSQNCFTPTPANQQLLPTTQVSVLSGQDVNSLTPLAVPNNLINQDCATFWNPSGDVFDYRLKFTLAQSSQIQSISVSILGDLVHDSTGIEIYSNSSFTGTPLVRAPLTVNSNIQPLNTSTVNLSTNQKFIQFASNVNLVTNDVYVKFLPALITRPTLPPANIIVNKVQFFGLPGVNAANKRLNQRRK